MRPLPIRPVGALVAIGLLVLLGLMLAGAGPARGASGSTPLSGGISGPTEIGVGLKGTYIVNATGGPAEAANGTQVGIYSYTASISAVNTTGAAVLPSRGVLVNQSVELTVTAPNVTESLTVYVSVTSSLNGSGNVSTNLSLTISVVQPYHLAALLRVTSSSGTSPFNLTVDLDGRPVGQIGVPALTGGTSYPLAFDYVTAGLAAGWHTFSISLAQEHGLVSFAGGQETFSQAFYVQGPAPNYTLYIVGGIVAFVGVVFIWTARVGARRRGRAKR